MNQSKQDMAVVITGACGGIGRALCQAFSANDYFVVGTGRDAEKQENCHAFVELELDAFAEDAALRSGAIQDLQAATGGRPLRALVCNAAVQILADVDTLTVADWRSTLNVNLLAPFLLAQGLLDLLEATHGSVINISSIHARLTKPQFVAYATSKAALEGLTRSMAVDLGPRIRVNAISPAAIETDMLSAGFEGNPEALKRLAECHPVGQLGQPEQVAELALFLASEKADFLSGGVLSLDGGIAARLHDPI